MKETNTQETAFDALFREELGNAATPVPPGVWEGISASIGSAGGSAVAGSAVKTALWMKAAISAALVSAIAFTAYQLNKPENSTAGPESVKENVQSTDKLQLQNPENESNTNMQMPVTEQKKSSGSESEQIITPNEAPIPDAVGYDQRDQPEAEQTPAATEQPRLIQPSAEPALKPEGTAPEKTEDMISEAPAAPAPAAKDSSFIEVPNSFTPNGDGINDTYLIRLVNEERVEIVIYNPLSNEILFRTKNKYQGWNGLLPNGDPAPAGGTYVVKVIYKFRGQPEARPIFSKLTLIR